MQKIKLKNHLFFMDKLQVLNLFLQIIILDIM